MLGLSAGRWTAGACHGRADRNGQHKADTEEGREADKEEGQEGDEDEGHLLNGLLAAPGTEDADEAGQHHNEDIQGGHKEVRVPHAQCVHHVLVYVEPVHSSQVLHELPALLTVLSCLLVPLSVASIKSLPKSSLHCDLAGCQFGQTRVPCLGQLCSLFIEASCTSGCTGMACGSDASHTDTTVATEPSRDCLNRLVIRHVL